MELIKKKTTNYTTYYIIGRIFREQHTQNKSIKKNLDAFYSEQISKEKEILCR